MSLKASKLPPIISFHRPMTYQSSISISYTSKWESLSRNSGYDSDMFLPEEKMEFTIPNASDLNTKQMFRFFKKVMLAMGYAEKSIAVGAISIVFNEDGDEALQRAMCDKFDLTLNEDLQDKFEDFKKTEAEWDRIKKTDYQGLVAKMRRNMDETEEPSNG
jgi:hypothetical protein